MESEKSRLFVPDLPPADVRARQRERFFGVDHGWHSAILTPIRMIYNALPHGETLTGGWWPSKEWDNVLVCATPQASAILDPLCALEPTTRVLFLGLAGSLERFAIGDAVEASAVLLDSFEYRPTWKAAGRYPAASAVTVRCLNESYALSEEISRRADVVDMESAWVCAAAQQHTRQARVVLIVSDELNGPSFVDAEFADIAQSISAVAAHAAQDLVRRLA
jgi:nucleoside phosphorylase